MDESRSDQKNKTKHASSLQWNVGLEEGVLLMKINAKQGYIQYGPTEREHILNKETALFFFCCNATFFCMCST